MSSIYHTLKGIPGLSTFQLSRIDVRRALQCIVVKRLFKIFDRDYDYKLIIQSDNKGSKLFFNKNTNLISTRYKTLEDVNKDINRIKELQQIVEDYDNKYINLIKSTLDKKDTYKPIEQFFPSQKKEQVYKPYTNTSSQFYSPPTSKTKPLVKDLGSHH
jgi:hypothetical protein